jgi:hypothetical protein
VILDMLAEGSVNLTAVRLLAPHLTPSNYREVLDSARGKRKPEVEEIVATLSPRPDVPASVRRLTGCGIWDVALSSERTVTGAMSAGSSSSTTSIRTLWVGRRPSIRSNRGAVVTTITKAGCISASADVEPMAGS